ncbi:MAG: hypothetical protein Q9195_008733 [Heterodermia aff. obscurata]
MGRDRYPKQSLGALHGRIKQSRILMVGAGGIGCELLKNLVLTGFGEVHIVDLDTIDLSNLNRQFLFRHEHIKKSKALVAKDSASKFNPHVKLEAHHANIKDPRFNIDWFQGFDLVFNALDNLDARRHVNKMCLAADVPLIESGTTGFNGQVQVIKKVPKSFPVCTIRSTPSQPIHCIVWAKSYLFTEIFGTSEDETPELDNSEDSENAKEIENLRKESQALKEIKQSMNSPHFPRRVFEKVFRDDISRLRSMEDMWKTRKPPQALDYDAISRDASEIHLSICHQDQVTWDLAQNFSVFCESLHRLSSRLHALQVQGAAVAAPAVLTFDKDDDDTLDFVAASANLRSFVFGIEPRSKFDIKQMAGNIIPAIATTNAMTASLCVLQAFKVMREDLTKAKMVFLTRSTDRVITTDNLRPPNPNCSVCSVMQSQLHIDPARATLNDLVSDVLKDQLKYGDEFSVNSEAGTLYDPELDDNLSKSFTDLGVKSDSFLTVIDDDDENPRVNLSLSILEKPLPPSSAPILLPRKLEIARKPKIVSEAQPLLLNGTGAKRKRSPEDSVLDQEQLLKRQRGEGDDDTIAAKKARIEEDMIVLDDSSGGAIVIDDE